MAGLRGTLNWFENRPLFGRRIVVTRAREQASGLARSLTDLGAEVIQCPTIEIRPLEDYAALDAALARLAEYQWIIFTSVNGVRCFWQRLEAAGKDSRALGGCRVAAIGPATAQALRGHGIAPDFVPERYVAEGVLEGLLAARAARWRQALFAAPRGQGARSAARRAAQGRGRGGVLPAYAAVPAAHNQETVLRCLEEGRLDCVTFGSSSTVENFLALIPAATLKAHPETQLAAIGPVTAQTLAAHGLPCHIQPAEYTTPALVAALQTHFARSARA